MTNPIRPSLPPHQPALRHAPAGVDRPALPEPVDGLAPSRAGVGALFDSPTLRSASVFALPVGLVTGDRCTADGGLPVYDATRLGVVEPDGRERWMQTLPPGVHTPPVVSPDGTRMALGGWGWVHLHDSATGEIVGSWERGLEQLKPQFDARGRLLVSDWEGGGLALLQEGRPDPVWTVERDELPEGLASGPDGTVLQTGWHKPTRALDGETGALKWKGPESAPLQGTPAVAPDGTVVSRADGGDLVAVDAGSGALLWTSRPGERLDDPVLSADGRSVVVPLDPRHLAGLDVATGGVRWQATLEGDRAEGPFVGPQGELVLGDRTGRLYVLDAAQGTLLETGRVEGPVHGVTPLPDRELAVLDSRGQLHRMTSRPSSEAGTIEQGEEFVLIGDVRIPVRR